MNATSKHQVGLGKRELQLLGGGSAYSRLQEWRELGRGGATKNLSYRAWGRS